MKLNIDPIEMFIEQSTRGKHPARPLPLALKHPHNPPSVGIQKLLRAFRGRALDDWYPNVPPSAPSKPNKHAPVGPSTSSNPHRPHSKSNVLTNWLHHSIDRPTAASVAAPGSIIRGHPPSATARLHLYDCERHGRRGDHDERAQGRGRAQDAQGAGQVPEAGPREGRR